MMPQIIYARAIGNDYQALILRWSGQLFVGVAFLLSIEHTIGRWDYVTTDIRLRWLWQNTIREDEVESYIQRTDWQRECQLNEQKQIKYSG